MAIKYHDRRGKTRFIVVFHFLVGLKIVNLVEQVRLGSGLAREYLRNFRDYAVLGLIFFLKLAIGQKVVLGLLGIIIVIGLFLGIFLVFKARDVYRKLGYVVRLCSSFINTLKDSGTPGSGTFSPFTIAS